MGKVRQSWLQKKRPAYETVANNSCQHVPAAYAFPARKWQYRLQDGSWWSGWQWWGMNGDPLLAPAVFLPQAYSKPKTPMGFNSNTDKVFLLISHITNWNDIPLPYPRWHLLPCLMHFFFKTMTIQPCSHQLASAQWPLPWPIFFTLLFLAQGFPCKTRRYSHWILSLPIELSSEICSTRDCNLAQAFPVFLDMSCPLRDLVKLRGGGG